MKKVLVFVSLSLFFYIASVNTVLAVGYLSGVWHLDEGNGNIAYDSSGHENHGQINGASWTSGIVGTALHFTGGTTYDTLMVPDSDSLDLTDTLRLEAWFKPDITIDTSEDYYYALILKWHGIGDQWRTGYGLNISGGKLYLILGWGSGEGNWYTYCASRDNWQAGEWYHIKATYDKNLPSENIKIYINGSLDATYDETKKIATNTLPLYINQDPFESWNSHVRSFPGVIDEVIVGSLPNNGGEEEETCDLAPVLNELEEINIKLDALPPERGTNGASTHIPQDVDDVIEDEAINNKLDGLKTELDKATEERAALESKLDTLLIILGTGETIDTKDLAPGQGGVYFPGAKKMPSLDKPKQHGKP